MVRATLGPGDAHMEMPIPSQVPTGTGIERVLTRAPVKTYNADCVLYSNELGEGHALMAGYTH